MYIGLDIGTSSVKALLMDHRQTVHESAEVPLKVQRPRPGWSEQNPDSWWRATLQALDALATAKPGEMSEVRGIGLSGQMHGATLLDAADKPLRPCILWNDGRSTLECEELEARDAKFRRLGGNIVMPGFTAPKLRWVQSHEPSVFDKIAKVLLPKDYVRLKLTGDHASDMSDSSGTLWMDVGNRRWSPELLSATELDAGQMPALFEGTEATGTVRSSLAKRWKMTRNPIVAGGGGDNAASACGSGTIRPGDAFVSLGTSGVLFVSNEGFSPNTDGAVHAMCHALPQTWHQMGVVLSAASCIDWLAGILGVTPAELLSEMKQRPDAPSRVMFAPYLSGERTPHNDANVRGCFALLDHAAGRADLVHAVLDGVAFAMRDCFEALKVAGTDIVQVTAVGGGSRSKTWLDILANVLNIPVHVSKGSDQGAAFGAARLALVAESGADPRSVCTPSKIARSHLPTSSLSEAYAAGWLRHQKVYPALKELTAA